MLLKRVQRAPAELRRGKLLQLLSIFLPLAALVLCLILRAVIADPGNGIPMDEFPIPTAAQVFSDTDEPDHSWAVEFSELLCGHSYLRQKGPYIIDPETGSSYSSWYYDADVYHIAWQWVADGYVKEHARVYELREITVPGWAHAWYSADNAMWAARRCCCKTARRSGRSTVTARKACWTRWTYPHDERGKENAYAEENASLLCVPDRRH